MIINKKQRLLILVSVSILIALILIFVYFNVFKKKETEGIIVAEAGGTKLTAEELYNLVEEAKKNTPEMYRETVTPDSVMEQWIEFQLLSQEGIKRGYSKDPDVKKKLDDYMKSLVVGKLWDEEIEKKITDVSDGELLKYYEKIKNRDYLLKYDVLRLRVITVKGEAEARRIREKAVSGEDFASLASKYSIYLDNRDKGGDMGYLKASDLPKEVADVVSNLKKGEISNPIKIAVGYSIYKIEDILKTGEYMPYDYIKKQLKDRYLADKKKEAATDFVETLKKENQPIKYLSRYTDYLNERYKEEKNKKEDTTKNK